MMDLGGKVGFSRYLRTLDPFRSYLTGYSKVRNEFQIKENEIWTQTRLR